ncbi:hypothetical protein GQ54DRAFT_301829 [Martensiomyces pterosporus]|nr:hypothetical protein GQ54DRAFT_301829 [Martensiomyces pterosporus]
MDANAIIPFVVFGVLVVFAIVAYLKTNKEDRNMICCMSPLEEITTSGGGAAFGRPRTTRQSGQTCNEDDNLSGITLFQQSGGANPDDVTAEQTEDSAQVAHNNPVSVPERPQTPPIVYHARV